MARSDVSQRPGMLPASHLWEIVKNYICRGLGFIHFVGLTFIYAPILRLVDAFFKYLHRPMVLGQDRLQFATKDMR